MAQETVSIRTDSTLKNQVAVLSEKLGFNTTTAVNMFFRAFVQTGGLPFNVVIDPLSDPNEKKKVMAELKYRVAEADKPGAQWYSLAEVKKELGV
jgi:addiction module RelB/DinJ family antitoxin